MSGEQLIYANEAQQQELRHEINRVKKQLGTWTAVQEVLGINKGHAWKLAKGKARASLEMYSKVMEYKPEEMKEVTMKVPPGCGLKVVGPSRERVRRPRWSVPADSIEDLARYLCKRLSYKQQIKLRREMIFLLEEEQK